MEATGVWSGRRRRTRIPAYPEGRILTHEELRTDDPAGLRGLFIERSFVLQ